MRFPDLEGLSFVRGALWSYFEMTIIHLTVKCFRHSLPQSLAASTVHGSEGVLAH